MTDSPGVQQMLSPDSALPEIPFADKLWKVGRPDQDAKARLEKLAKKVAIDQVRELKGVLDPAAYKEAFGSVLANLSNYDTWREGWQAVVFDAANAHLFLWSLLQAHHPTISEAVVKAIVEAVPEEIQLALAQVMPDFFAQTLVGVPMTADQREKVGALLTGLRARLTPTPKTP